MQTFQWVVLRPASAKEPDRVAVVRWPPMTRVDLITLRRNGTLYGKRFEWAGYKDTIKGMWVYHEATQA